MDKIKFPPVDWLWREYDKNYAWYSGDGLSKVAHGGGISFWKTDEEIKVHVPIAADLSAMSASMIFSDSPKVTTDDEKTQLRIDEIMQKASIYSTLLQAAELASAFGGVFMKWSWDISDGFPRLTAVPANAGMPCWQNGKLAKIVLWSIVKETDTGTKYRLQEEYLEDGHIRSKLMKGDDSNIGTEIPLDSIEETAGIKPDANSGTDRMLAIYVPNLLPNRQAPHLLFGRSDYHGLYGLFDELDEAYSAIQRETRLTKTMVVVPMEYLQKKEALRHAYNSEARKTEWVFSSGKGAFVALDIDTTENSNPITVINPELRAESRIAAVEDIIRRILSLAGYAPQSAGIDVDGRAESGTALNIKERKSIRTSEVKKTFWWHALNDIIRTMLALDSAIFRSGIDAKADFSVELPSSMQPDISQLAQTVEQLERAGAVSTETKVNILHPDWSEEQKAEEVARIKEERGYSGPDPLDANLGDFEKPNENPEGDEGE